MVDRDEHERLLSVVIDILDSRLNIMTQNERKFAISILHQWHTKRRLTDKQLEAARNLALRMILERDRQFPVSS